MPVSTEVQAYLDRFGALAPDLLCEELLVYNAHRLDDLWKHLSGTQRSMGPLPYWGIVWPGGRGLAHYILKNPHLVSGRRVLDLGTGSGIVAVACARAGAVVTGTDLSLHALELAQLTAHKNNVACEFKHGDILAMQASDLAEYELIVAADLFYDEPMARRSMALLREAMGVGVDHLLGDPMRNYRPQSGFTLLKKMRVPVYRDIEGVDVRDVQILRLTVNSHES